MIAFILPHIRRIYKTGGMFFMHSSRFGAFRRQDFAFSRLNQRFF